MPHALVETIASSGLCYGHCAPGGSKPFWGPEPTSLMRVGQAPILDGILRVQIPKSCPPCPQRFVSPCHPRAPALSSSALSSKPQTNQRPVSFGLLQKQSLNKNQPKRHVVILVQWGAYCARTAVLSVFQVSLNASKGCS